MLLLTATAYAQNAFADSLQGEIKKATTDTARARLTGELAWSICFIDPNRAIKLADEAIIVWEKNNSPLGLADAYRTKALAFVLTKKTGEALKLYYKAIDYARKAKSDFYEASCNSLIGGLYGDTGDNDKSIEFYTRALTAALRTNDKKLLASNYNNLAVAYSAAGRSPELTLKYFYTALDYQLQLDNSSSAGLIYGNIAGQHLQQGKKTAAINAADSAIILAITGQARGYQYAATCHEVGGVYLDLGLYEPAEKYFLESYKLFDSMNRPDNMLRPMLGLVTLYNKKNDLPKAKKAADDLQAKSTAQSAKYYISEAYKALAEIAKKQNKPAEALGYLENYNRWNDSVFNDTREQSIANVETRALLDRNELEVKYETEKHLLENETLKQSNKSLKIQVVGALLGLAILVLLGILLLRAYNENKKRNKELEQQKLLIEKQSKEKDVLLHEIHHRVKNNLQIVSSMLNLQANAVNDEHAKEALRESHNRVKSIALIHQKLYSYDELSTILLKDYVEQLCNHLKVVYSATNITFTNDVQPADAKLEMEAAIPLGLILNELITNSIKYAFPNNQQGLISIQFRQNVNGGRTITIGDNGVGISEQFQPGQTKSLGFRIVNELTRQIKGTIETRNSDGAQFIITFPAVKK
jgi:two-component sensor histidine kinase/tetratricopeptide (TPR) repeat protein